LVEAHVLCDRICLMDSGEVIALDTPRNLVSSLQSDSAIEFRLPEGRKLSEEEQAVLMEQLKLLQKVKQVDWRQEVYVLYTDHLQVSLIDLIQRGEAEQWQIVDLQTRTATLEDVFIHMTGRSLREA
jgi:ABC-2 type transport system ATP-binding protein